MRYCEKTYIVPFGTWQTVCYGTNGLTYLRARYYNPALGRFLTPDSLIPDVTNGQALNAYAYVYNDPVNLVDPAGNIPGLGDMVVAATKATPESWQPRIQNMANQGINGLNWWYSKPDNCDCNGGSKFEKGLGYFTNQAYQLGLNYVTSPALYYASEVSGGHNGQTLATRTNYNITKWGPRGPVRDSRYIVSQLDDGFQVQNKGGKASMRVRDPHFKPGGGNAGILPAVLGAGFIDGIFQFIKDKAIDNLCLSPNQFFWRGVVAFLIGTAAAIAGVGVVVVLGVTGGMAVAVAFGASLLFSFVFNPVKDIGLEYVTEWQP